MGALCDFQRIRAENPLDEIYERLTGNTLHQQQSWKMGLCPFHHERTPSFGIRGDTYFCFGCRQYGDVVDLCKHLGRSIDLTSYTIEESGVPAPTKTHALRSRPTPQPIPLEVAEATHFALIEDDDLSHVREYLSGRGLSTTTIARQKIGWTWKKGGRITIPIWGWNREDSDGPNGVFKILDMMAYSMNPEINPKTNKPFPKMLPLFVGQAGTMPYVPFPNRVRKDEPVWIVEGEFDALVLTDYGFNAVSNTHGAAAMPGCWSTENWRHIVEQAIEIRIVTDNDDAGKHALVNTIKSLWGHPNLLYLKWPADFKSKGDITDWVKAGNDPGSLVMLLREVPTKKGRAA